MFHNVHRSIQATEYTPKTKHQESVWVEINRHNNMIVRCIYNSPNSDINNHSSLLDLLKEVCLEQKFSHVLIMGDFNYRQVDWTTWKTNGSENSNDFKFVQILRDTYLHQHVTEPTRARGTNIPSTLDLILTNEEGMVSDIKYHSPIGKSDHACLKFNLNCFLEVEKAPEMKYFYNKADFAGMKRELAEIDWDLKLDNCNVNKQWEIFIEIVSELKDRFIPHKIIDSIHTQKGKVPLDHHTVELIHKKDRQWKRYMETRDPQKYREYFKSRNKARKRTRHITKLYEKSIAENARSNPKAVWQYIKSKANVKQGIPHLLTDPNNESSPLTTNDQEKAETLADFFTSVFTQEPDAYDTDHNPYRRRSAEDTRKTENQQISGTRQPRTHNIERMST